MTTRGYSSALREAQVEQTRALLMERARALVLEGGARALTLPKLAQAAGVSVPTVYRYFPTLDDLFRAFLDELRPQLGQSTERLTALAPEELPGVPLENFPRYEAQAPILRLLMDTPEFNRIRVARVRDRARRAAKQIRAQAPGWSDAQLEAMVGALWALNSPQSWRWLRDTWGLENDEAARAASWAMSTLLQALARGPKPSERKPARPGGKRQRGK